MNILIIGAGGREHAFTWKIRQSSHCDKLFVAPGNAGTSSVAENINIAINDFEKLGDFALKNAIELILVGPEAPLVEGIADYFRNKPSLSKILLVGPDKKGAQLEGSKDFSKAFMNRHGIPTAASKTFTTIELEAGLAYLETHSLPIVLKADGLAAGKGVIISEDREEAKAELTEMLANRKFGAASAKVVVEQYLTGIELSVFAITDGVNYQILPEAKDYKRIGEGDTGPNTGGMGAVSPVPFADKAFMKKVEDKVIKPTIKGLIEEDIKYVGFLFFGLMNVDGEPYVIEYNARMGDPETEVVIPRLKSDFVELLIAAAKGTLDKVTLEFDQRTATTVMLVAGGYPESYEKGNEITGIEHVKEALAFHAGTSLKNDKVVTNGGRVMALTAFGTDIKDALAKSNAAAEVITWERKYYRKDIGLDLLKSS